jgi:hypothetical protein
MRDAIFPKSDCLDFGPFAHLRVVEFKTVDQLTRVKEVRMPDRVSVRGISTAAGENDRPLFPFAETVSTTYEDVAKLCEHPRVESVSLWSMSMLMPPDYHEPELDVTETLKTLPKLRKLVLETDEFRVRLSELPHLRTLNLDGDHGIKVSEVQSLSRLTSLSMPLIKSELQRVAKSMPQLRSLVLGYRSEDRLLYNFEADDFAGLSCLESLTLNKCPAGLDSVLGKTLRSLSATEADDLRGFTRVSQLTLAYQFDVAKLPKSVTDLNVGTVSVDNARVLGRALPRLCTLTMRSSMFGDPRFEPGSLPSVRRLKTELRVGAVSILAACPNLDELELDSMFTGAFFFLLAMKPLRRLRIDLKGPIDHGWLQRCGQVMFTGDLMVETRALEQRPRVLLE